MNTISKLLILLMVASINMFSQVTLDVAFPNLTFSRPVDLQNASDGTNRIFVVEQSGIIRVFPNDPSVATAAIFLDIRNKVDDSSNEEGLLGLAFHPDFPDSAYFYINYTATNPNRSVIARYAISQNDTNAADPNSELVLLEIDKPYSNHNAGALAFGPNDGFLYITTGDGGDGGDPLNNGQNRSTLLGSILRIDVDSIENGKNYAIPEDNPFKGNSSGWREEIFAYGLRNPWRISFDPETGWLWAGEVGQNQIEEVNIIENGKNYGWRLMEGNQCYNPPNCDTAGLTLPIWQYTHSLGQSITGGYVYRGSEIEEWVGSYVYADYVSGRIWLLNYDGSSPATNALYDDTNLFISSFGVDESRELYLCAFNGRIYRFNANPNGVTPEPSLPQGFRLQQNFPNPFNPATNIPFELTQNASVKLAILDANGREVINWNWSQLTPGNHLVNWSGVNFRNEPVAGGSYFYRLTVDGRHSQTRKLTLVK